jgi:hypothetical protein
MSHILVALLMTAPGIVVFMVGEGSSTVASSGSVTVDWMLEGAGRKPR